MMRDQGSQHRVQQAVSHDASATWDDLDPAQVPNHDNSVVVRRLSKCGFIMVHNDVPVGGGSPRQWLRLSSSTDAQHWIPRLDVQRGVSGEEFSYPAVQEIGGQLHVSFTRKRQAIGHQVYDISYEEDIK